MPLDVFVPDIGDFDDVEVVEVLVAKGDEVAEEDPLCSIESDKATMELPSPHAGVVVSVAVSVGDKVSEGALVCSLEVAPDAASTSEPAMEPSEPASPPGPAQGLAASPGGATPSTSPSVTGPRPAPLPPVEPGERAGAVRAHASPLVRRQARELGVDLAAATGSGPHGRILEQDLKQHVRDVMTGGGGGGIPAIPEVDFARFGPVEEVALPKIRRVSATNLSRAWLNVPHVTQHDEADVTELERYRRERKARAAEAGVKLSPLVFAMKATVQALRRFPDFRSSLAPGGEALVRKDYFHLGVAVDTEHGLVVPVIRDVDRKGILELSRELSEVAERARARKLTPSDLSGAVFSISSLGGIGGTAFTPIVNAPEVAILGLSRLQTRPLWLEDDEAGGRFVPRQVLPLSLSYDHRVIDGASAARFTTELVRVLSDPTHLLL